MDDWTFAYIFVGIFIPLGYLTSIAMSLIHQRNGASQTELLHHQKYSMYGSHWTSDRHDRDSGGRCHGRPRYTFDTPDGLNRTIEELVEWNQLGRKKQFGMMLQKFTSEQDADGKYRFLQSESIIRRY